MSLFSFISLLLLINLFPEITVAGDEDGLRTYIVHVQKPKHENFSMETDLESWYHSFLPAASSSEASNDPRQSRMLHSYRHVLSGFAARLTAEEVKAMETKPGFISARVEQNVQLHTTHTPDFLGLIQNSGFWKDSNYGKGVIIGVIDTGISPRHPSFRDAGMPAPPAKWKGRCEFQEAGLCNNKIIGARSFVKSGNPEPPFENPVHGSHCAAIAAGAVVEGANIDGLANGTSSGIAPLAHLAIYKVCEHKDDKECPESRVGAAMDAAIEEGVDVLSLSLGVGFSYFYDNVIAIAAFNAVRKGIFVSISAGNFGPKLLVNDAPWMLTVGAGTIDRSSYASIQLGNGVQYRGETKFNSFPSEPLPLIYPGAVNDSAAFCSRGSLSGIHVEGKIVLCQMGGGSEFDEKLQEVNGAGGAFMIFTNDELSGNRTETHGNEPTVHVTHNAGESIKGYIKSTPSPTGLLVFEGTKISIQSAPEVAYFSSRGPSGATPGILKPDIIGPGFNILAASPSKGEPTFAFYAGTSSSCPHLSGIAAMLKNTHPDWSPAAIKSAIMTTAYKTNNLGKPIADQITGLQADLFALGAGHVDPSKANDPGLVYDLVPDDYIPYLCGLNYTDQQVHKIVNRQDVECSKVSSIPEAELNYPSFSIKLGWSPKTYTRTVTNVGEANVLYTSRIVAPDGVEISVQPERMHFTEKGQKVTYSVTFTKTKKTEASNVEAQLSWVSSQHTVNSPIAISFEPST